jgi:hypothetical protein
MSVNATPMECNMNLRNGGCSTRNMQITQNCTVPKTKLLFKKKLSVPGTISHLKATHLGSTKKLEAGMGNGKSIKGESCDGT